MTVHEINEIRSKYSKTTRPDSPWNTSWDEMACKTVLKRTGKRAPVSTEVQQAINLDDRSELGLGQDLDVIPIAPEDITEVETPVEGEEANPSQSSAPPTAPAPSPTTPVGTAGTGSEDAGAPGPSDAAAGREYF